MTNIKVRNMKKYSRKIWLVHPNMAGGGEQTRRATWCRWGRVWGGRLPATKYISTPVATLFVNVLVSVSFFNIMFGDEEGWMRDYVLALEDVCLGWQSGRWQGGRAGSLESYQTFVCKKQKEIARQHQHIIIKISRICCYIWRHLSKSNQSVRWNVLTQENGCSQ